jgi:hypothetical protein
MQLTVRNGLITLAVFLLAACGKINRENFDKISDGMIKQDVIQILGEPTETSSASLLGISGGNATWRDGKTVINVQFLNNKVIGKEMGMEDQPR